MRRLLKVAAPLALAAGLVAATATGASADTKYQDGGFASVWQSTATGAANADVSWTDSTGNGYVGVKNSSTFAEAGFNNLGTGFKMNAWLERSTNGGRSWYTISSVHAVNSANANDDEHAGTYAYYDGPGYLARSCFQFTSWSGAAVHCSPGI